MKHSIASYPRVRVQDSGRQVVRLARHWPWTGHITAALERLALLPNPG